jgi:hypothetical protein
MYHLYADYGMLHVCLQLVAVINCICAHDSIITKRLCVRQGTIIFIFRHAPLLLFKVMLCFQAALDTKHKMGPAADKLTLIHYNDVYNVEPRDQEPEGGAARYCWLYHQIGSFFIQKPSPGPNPTISKNREKSFFLYIQ